MQLIWYGHSCFMIKTNEGKRILIDPFNKSLGYKIDFPKCDLITISHSHFDHASINSINNDTKVIDTYGNFNLDFLQLKGFNSFHDDYNGLKRGMNIIYIYKFNNLTLAHLGDLGHIPAQPILNELNSLDFLLIPIGGNFTLDGKKAANLCKLLTPRYIIPMHYKTPVTDFALNDSKDFIISMKKVSKVNTNSIDLLKLDLKTKNMETILLQPPY